MTNLFLRPSKAALFICMVLAAVNVASAQTFTVVEPINFKVSSRLSDIRGGSAPVNGPTEIPHHPLPPQANYRNGRGTGDGEPPVDSSSPIGPDTALQTTFGPLVNATTGAIFDGLSVYQGGYIPSDSNIAVGKNHLVETVNEAYAVYSKTGSIILGANSLRSLWTGLGGNCSSNGAGDPIVQYDQVADRWIITQMGSLSNPYSECIAVSTSPDPTGTYYMYSYSFGSNLNDYPKFSVWSTPTNSAYLASYNLFANGSNFVSAEICAYDRAAMLSGAPNPVGLCYTGLSGHSFQPSDIDGATPPPDGTPAYFVNLNLLSSNSLNVYKLTPNFATQTATLNSQSISVASFSQAPDAVQPGTTKLLDALSDRLMYRLAVRMFGSKASMVVNHSVTNANSASGVRWYELRADLSTSTDVSLYQQGTFSPDSSYRWMGSAAMDQAGDIAIGYSVSSSTVYPSIRYTGRTPADALGTMQSEASLRVGSGSQTGYTRWGDYSSLRIDPIDDCTFWYVNEFLPTTSSYGWYTNISSFKFSGCGGSTQPDFSLSANPVSITVQQGSPGNSTITVTSIGGWSESVGLTVTSGCPTNATCTFSSSPVTPTGTSTLTITTNGNTTAGPYTLVVTGTGTVGNKTHTLNIPVTVSVAPPPAPDFSISLSASTLTVKRGANGSVGVVTTAQGGNSTITFSISGLPSRTSATFTPGSVTSGNGANLKVSANSTGPKGTFTVTVTGQNANFTHSTPLTLTIN
jgi:hypothetical protein